MLYKYCPKCCSLNLKKIMGSASNFKCQSCEFEGEVKADSIDKINILRKQMKLGIDPTPNYDSYLMKDTQKVDLKNKLNKLSNGAKSGDWELL